MEFLEYLCLLTAIILSRFATVVVVGQLRLGNKNMWRGYGFTNSSPYVVDTFVDLSISVCVEQCALRPACWTVEYNYAAKFCKLISIFLSSEERPGYNMVLLSQWEKERFLGNTTLICLDHQTLNKTNGLCENTGCGYPKTSVGGKVLGNMNSIHSKVKIEGPDETGFRVCCDNGKWTEYDIEVTKANKKHSPLTCGEMQNQQPCLTSGVYRNKFDVILSCDLDKNGGRWTLFQRRFNGKENFERNWNDYENGFGDLTGNGEFWLGLKPLAQILHSSKSVFELRIDIMDWDGVDGFAVYKNFNISDRNDFYRLTIGNYSGTIGDDLSSVSGQQFTTLDVDNDNAVFNCAEYGGGWWFNGCFRANLNADYTNGPSILPGYGIVWVSWRGWDTSLKETSMKIREILQKTIKNDQNIIFFFNMCIKNKIFNSIDLTTNYSYS